MRPLIRSGKACALLFLIAACSDGGSGGNGNRSDNTILEIADASVELPPDVGAPFLLTTVSYPLAEVGYQQHEYFLAGTASGFSATGDLTSDGRWQVEPVGSADYTTRIVLYRPVDPDAFSGTVLVEWLNVTAGFESQPTWGAAHTEIVRSGHAWVGVSAQFAGVEGVEGALLPAYLKAADPERYARLSHPGDSYSYDIFSQVGKLLRQGAEIDIFQGLEPERFIASGQSQSATRVLTYINAIHPVHNAYDAYLLHSRVESSAPLAQAPQTPISAPGIVMVRTDLSVPVLNVQSETDVIGLGALASRQADSELFRLWEVAGSSHSDYYGNLSGREDRGVDPVFAIVVEESSVAGVINCEQPMNAGPMPWVVNAAIDALHRWLKDAVPPAGAARLEISDDSRSILADEFGNALGGVRTPYVDAPAARLSGEVNAGESFCGLFGRTELFSADFMASLYVDKAGYQRAVADATDDAVAEGFLLSADAERIKAAAALQWDRLALQ